MFEFRSLLAVALLPALVCFGSASAAGQTSRPNVLLILGEDHGAHTGAYGTTGVSTPNLDALAATGTLFQRAYVTTATCSPSKAAILTGVYNHRNGVEQNVYGFVGSADDLAAENPEWLSDPHSPNNTNPIAADVPTLIEVLQSAGYYTGTQSNFHLPSHERFPYDHWSRTKIPNEIESFVAEANQASQPWFLTYHARPAHRPYAEQSIVPPGVSELPGHLPDSPVAHQDWANYLADVQTTDRQVGGVLNALERTGQANNTYVIYMGDHGPAYHRGKYTTYNFGLQVPLIVSGPGVQAGYQSGELVSGVDLMPTILDALEIAPPALQHGISQRNELEGMTPTQSNQYLVGASLTDRSITDGRFHLLSTPVAADTYLPPDNRNVAVWGNAVYDDIVANKDHPAYQQAYRLLDLADASLPDFHRGAFELYDLENDPWEVNDLASQGEYQPHVNRLKVALQLWADDKDDPAVRLFRTQAYQGPLPRERRDSSTTFTDIVGSLDSSSTWTTNQLGKQGADFAVQGGVLDAPPGYRAVATLDEYVYEAEDSFVAQVEVLFDRPGVGAGLVFGFIDPQNYYEFQLLDGSVAVDGGLDKDVRLVRFSDGQPETLLLETGLPNYAGGWNQLSVDYHAESAQLGLKILDSSQQIYFEHSIDFDYSILTGSRFGIVSALANHAKLDNFTLDLAAYTPRVKMQWEEPFTTHLGPLDADSRWQTRLFGKQGADFEQTGTVVGAPKGFRALATFESMETATQDDFQASVDVHYDRPGVGAGLVLGYSDEENFFEFQLLDGRTNPGGRGKDVRLVQIEGGVETNLLFESALADYDGGWYSLSAEYDAVEELLALRILDSEELVYFDSTIALPAELFEETQFGISSWLSDSAVFDNFQVTLNPEGRETSALLGDFNGDELLDQADIDLLTAAYGPASEATAQFNLTLPDEVIDEQDLAFWLEKIQPLVLGLNASGSIAWVPEPTTGVLVLLPIASLFLKRRRIESRQ